MNTITAQEALKHTLDSFNIDIKPIRKEIDWEIFSAGKNGKRKFCYFASLTKKVESALIDSLEKDGFNVTPENKDPSDPLGKHYLEISW